jgi:hypothetical protein
MTYEYHPLTSRARKREEREEYLASLIAKASRYQLTTPRSPYRSE